MVCSYHGYGHFYLFLHFFISSLSLSFFLSQIFKIFTDRHFHSSLSLSPSIFKIFTARLGLLDRISQKQIKFFYLFLSLFGSLYLCYLTSSMMVEVKARPTRIQTVQMIMQVVFSRPPHANTNSVQNFIFLSILVVSFDKTY